MPLGCGGDFGGIEDSGLKGGTVEGRKLWVVIWGGGEKAEQRSASAALCQWQQRRLYTVPRLRSRALSQRSNMVRQFMIANLRW